MWLDAAVALLVVTLAALGFARGAAESGLRLAALPAAYGISLAASQLLGEGVGARLGGSPLLGAVLAGAVAFVLVQLAASVAVRVVRSQAAPPGGASRAAGALFGAARAVLLAIPFLWLASLSEGARLAGADAGLPDLSAARLRVVGTRAVALAAGGVLDERAAGDRVALRVAADPERAMVAVARIAGDPGLRILQADAGFWGDIQAGELDAALARPTYRQLERDEALRARLADVGAISRDAAADPRIFRVEVHDALAEIAPRLRALRDDPRLQRALADPEVRRQLAAGDTLALLANPNVRALVDGIRGGEP